MRGPLGGGIAASVQAPPAFITPLAGQFAAVGVAIAVSVRVAPGTPSLQLQLGAQAPVAAVIVGTLATATVTPTNAEVGVATPLTATAASGVAHTTVDVEANAAFWLDASNAASYTASGSNLTALKSLISGTALATIVGAPQFTTDIRDGKPAFTFPDNGSGDYVIGADATYIAAVTGTNRPFCSVYVVTPGDCNLSCAIDSVKNSGNSGNGVEFLNSGGSTYWEIDGAPSGPANVATSETLRAGLSIIVQHSADGLTVKTSVNGGAESTAAPIAGVGALTPNRVGVGVIASNAPSSPYYGNIRERIFFSTDKTAPQIAAIVAAMLRKWAPPPVCYFVGDSITTAQLATNGGMPTLLTQNLVALGLKLDPEGPLHGGQPYPIRHSALSGDTCAAMNTRVTDNQAGLGKGGSSSGFFQRTQLALIFAGTNSSGSAAATAAAYQTLLQNTATRLAQGVANWRIAVTTITDINGSSAYVDAYNALLPAIWDAFDAANPANHLIRWDARAALGAWNGANYVDAIHPNDAGYQILVNDPTHGLQQAVLPFLRSIQPP